MLHDIQGRILRGIFDEALLAVDPYNSVSRYCAHVLSRYEKERLNKLYMVGFGKAATAMARGAADFIGDRITKGILITKYGHLAEQHFADTVSVYEAGHPLPDSNGTLATAEVLKLLEEADNNTLVLFLISGGGSALLSSPCHGISLAEKQMVTELLLKAGADICELNSVRKHISAVKGGRLAEIASPAIMISLILSDVIGDPLDVIASGPTAPDTSRYCDALDVIRKYGATAEMPPNVINLITRGAQGYLPETPGKGAPVFSGVENIIIGNSTMALDAAKKAAERLGYSAGIISSVLTGEASEVGRYLAAVALERKQHLYKGEKLCLVSGGETTVTVKGDGKGGRNMELALAFGVAIQGESGITLLSAGSDGTDGPTDAAGALVDGRMLAEAYKYGLDPDDFLARNDSYNFFKTIGGLIITGPTGTNVMDIQLMLLE